MQRCKDCSMHMRCFSEGTATVLQDVSLCVACGRHTRRTTAGTSYACVPLSDAGIKCKGLWYALHHHLRSLRINVEGMFAGPDYSDRVQLEHTYAQAQLIQNGAAVDAANLYRLKAFYERLGFHGVTIDYLGAVWFDSAVGIHEDLVPVIPEYAPSRRSLDDDLVYNIVSVENMACIDLSSGPALCVCTECMDATRKQTGLISYTSEEQPHSLTTGAKRAVVRIEELRREVCERTKEKPCNGD